MTYTWQRADTAGNVTLTNAAPEAFSYAKIGTAPPGKTFKRVILQANWNAFVDASAIAADYPNAPWTNFSVHAIVFNHGSPTAPFPLDPSGNPPAAQDYFWRQGMPWASDWNSNVADFTSFRTPVDGRPIDTHGNGGRKANSLATESALWYVWHIAMVMPAGVTAGLDLTLSAEVLTYTP